MSENVDIYTRLHGARNAARDAEGLATGIDHVGDEAEQTGRQSRKGAAGVDRFGRATRSAETHGRRAARTFVSARTGLGGLRAGVVSTSAALFGGLGLISGLHLLYEEASDATHTSKATDAALKSTGASAWTSRRKIAAMSTALSEMSGVDDEVIQKSANMLLTFREVQDRAGRGNKIFSRANRAALDMAAGFQAAGKSMTPTDAALQLGKALNDPEQGMTRLTRVGITFTKQQKDQVAALIKRGKVAKAQGVILREVEKEFGGQARSQADPVKKLGVIWHNVAETLGLELLPYARKGARELGKLGKDVGQILGDKNYSAADKFHQVLTRLFGDRTEQQIEHVIDDFRQMGHDLAPLVKLGGGLARAVGRFAGKHPDVARLAFEILAVNKALKLMGFRSPIKGVRRLLFWLGRLATTTAGAKAASSIATALSASKMSGVGTTAGTALGSAIGKVAGPLVVAAIGYEIWQHRKWIIDQVKGDGGPGTISTHDVMDAVKKDPASYRPLRGGAHQGATGAPILGGAQRGSAGPTKGQHHGPGTRKRMAAPPAGRDIVIHNHHYLDGKEITSSVTRHTNADRNRR